MKHTNISNAAAILLATAAATGDLHEIYKESDDCTKEKTEQWAQDELKRKAQLKRERKALHNRVVKK